MLSMAKVAGEKRIDLGVLFLFYCFIVLLFCVGGGVGSGVGSGVVVGDLKTVAA